MKMFTPFGLAGAAATQKAEDASGNGGASAAAEPRANEDISELKSEMEAMRKQLAELAKERK